MNMFALVDKKVIGLVVLGGVLVTPGAAAVKWGYAEVAGLNQSLLLILDDSSQQVYVQASGPANAWFAWGFGTQMMNTPATVFGASGQGSLTDVYMTSYLQPATTSNLGGVQSGRNVSSCVSNDVIYYAFTYPLTAEDSLHYNFSAASATIPLVWARGSVLGVGGNYPKHTANSITSMATTNAPQPQFTQVTQTSGVTTLTITNLTVALTNQLQFTTNLSAGNWTTLANLVAQPPCGTNALTWVTELKFQTNASAGFWRIKQ
jgi:hypothetical protein